jgi:hypothetical protein
MTVSEYKGVKTITFKSFSLFTGSYVAYNYIWLIVVNKNKCKNTNDYNGMLEHEYIHTVQAKRDGVWFHIWHYYFDWKYRIDCEIEAYMKQREYTKDSALDIYKKVIRYSGSNESCYYYITEEILKRLDDGTLRHAL